MNNLSIVTENCIYNGLEMLMMHGYTKHTGYFIDIFQFNSIQKRNYTTTVLFKDQLTYDQYEDILDQLQR